MNPIAIRNVCIVMYSREEVIAKSWVYGQKPNTKACMTDNGL